ncbi:putative GRAND CENTRAL [Klebsormidium nitens]|uniref:Mediator of RNA polymerase II transcription subunit 13 n=1 Tax=Klebsormidium nitens TaxID=105231 RepID=A0A1Y1IQQ6_KLENI|nr:putative GRAND CENTRAL [Klebsormidium nitens]|eukprot:GAQ92382.1 putative GRAND CENTRAL [Klebsormidium nitens]
MVLSNIFRLTGYERLHWVLLTPEAGGPAGGTEAANLVLEAFLKLLNLGHLTTWRVIPSDDTKTGGGVQTSPLELWHFETVSSAPSDDPNKELLMLLPGFQVTATGTWSPQSRQPSVSDALSQAIANKLERAFKDLSYHKFGDVFIRTGRQDPSVESPLLACEVRLLSSPDSLYLQANVSRRNVRRLKLSDLSASRPLKVICSPSGEPAFLLGSCSPELVARLTQPDLTQPLDFEPRSEDLDSREKHRAAKKSEKRRGKHEGRAEGIGQHVEVQFDGSSHAGIKAGVTRRPSETLRNPLELDKVEVEQRPAGILEDESEENREADTQTGRDSDHPPAGGPATAEESDRGFQVLNKASVAQSLSALDCPKQSPDQLNPAGRTSAGRNSAGPDRLILPVERVLVSLPNLRQCAAELRIGMGLETVSGVGVTNGFENPQVASLAGWPSEQEASDDDSGSESGSLVDTDAEDEPAEGQLPEPGVKAEVAGHKRDRSEGLRKDDGPPSKVQKTEGGAQSLELLGSGAGEGGAGTGAGWWQDDGMEVGLLADFADFGDAFADVGGFGELPGTSPKGSPEAATEAPILEDVISPSASAAEPLPGARDGTASHFSAGASEVDPSEPLKVLLDDLFLEPTTNERPLSKGLQEGSPSPTYSLAQTKPSGGVAEEDDGLLLVPPEYRAAQLSLPARSDSSHEDATRVRYRPEETKVDFIRAVLGQGKGTAYEALPAGTSGLDEGPAEEVQLRGKYPKPRVRKTRKGELVVAERSGEHLEGSGKPNDGNGSEPRDAQEEVGRAGERKAGKRNSEGKGRPFEQKEEGLSGQRFSARLRSVVATDLVLLQREAARLTRRNGLLAAASNDGIGSETGFLQPSADALAGIHSEWAGSASAPNQQQPGLLLRGSVEGSSDKGFQKATPDWGAGVERKRRLLSPLLLQQAVSGCHNIEAGFRTGPWDEPELAAVGPVSAVAVAEVLASDVSEAFRAAFGEDKFCGPLTVDELCQEKSFGGVLKPPLAMQIGSPAIEHPVTPPQLWAVTLKPSGGVGSAGKSVPPLENPDVTDAETVETDVGIFKLLSAPPFLVGYQEDWLRIPQGVLKQWEKAPLEPYAAPKSVVYYAFCPATSELVSLCGRYLKEVGSTYEMCQLGSHVAASLPPDLATASAPGIASVAIASDPTVGNEATLKSGGERVEAFVEGIRTAATRLRLVGGNGREGREGSEDPCVVVYVVLPLCTDDQAKTATATIASILSGDRTGHRTSGTSGISLGVTQTSLADTRLTLQVISERDVTRAGFQTGAQEAFKRVAFDVYTKARGTNRKLPRGINIDGSSKGKAQEEGAGSGDPGGDGPLLFEPLVVLAEHPPICPVGPTGRSEERETGELEAGEHDLGAGSSVHCCYVWANDGATLVSVWTDGQGELLDAYVQTLAGDNALRSRRTDVAEIGGSLSAGMAELLQPGLAEGDGPELSQSGGVQRRAGPLENDLNLEPPQKDTHLEVEGACSHQALEALLGGLLDQCEYLLALVEAAIPEGEISPPCHVIMSRLGGIPHEESLVWARLLGGRQHDVSKMLRPVLHAGRSPPSGADMAHDERFASGGVPGHGRNLSLEMGGDALPPDMERFPFLEQQCLSPVSPGAFGGRFGGGDERGFQSPPETGRREPRGSLASVTLVVLERERSLQLVHGGDERQGSGSNPIAGMSARAVPPNRNDQLFIPSKPLQRLTRGLSQDGQVEPPLTPVASGYLLGDVRDETRAVCDVMSGVGSFVAGDDWPAAVRVDLISHFAVCVDNVNTLTPVENGQQGAKLLESIIEGFHALSWLNATDTGGCRSSVLPMHAAMVERIVDSVID